MADGTIVRAGAPVYGGDYEPVERVAPRCAHFGECGGCQYQNAGYAEQLRLKALILRGILADAGIEGVPEIGVHAGDEWGYRNRIRMRVERVGDGFHAGYSRRGTNEFLAVKECPIAAPVLRRAVEAVLRVGATDANCGRWVAAVSEVEVFCSADESRVQMQFYLRGPVDAGSFGGFCRRLAMEIPGLVGAGAELDPELNRRARRKWAGAAWGAPGMQYEVAGCSYWVSRGAFFQVNRWLVPKLMELVCGEERGGLAWDLFAGVGLFSRVLAEDFERVVAVEVGDVAAGDLAVAAKGGKGRRGFEAVHATTLDFLKQRQFDRERPELIVADPPRAGVGVEAAEVLAGIGAAKVVYVSCDPVTLARDLAILTREAYRVDAVEMVDLFPQTFHLETVVRLSRR